MSGDTTFKTIPSLRAVEEVREPALTIAAHPDVSRIGDRVFVADIPQGELTRLTPRFDAARGPGSAALEDRFVSRKALLISATGDGGLRIRRRDCEGTVRVGGQALGDERQLTFAELEEGVSFAPSRRVVLVAHLLSRTPADSQPELGFVGESDATRQLRARIRQVADLPIPVLVRGESGSGKELVARALHQASPRANAPHIAVNMAAMAPSMAGSQLFGHAKGAFTGATRDHAGHFVEADRGTLFLDEIGDAPYDVQAMLLRALETGQICPVGGTISRQVDVRLVAATDSDLEGAIAEGSFREPLYHRLASYQIEVPPLRQRRDDIGRLLVFFLRTELGGMGEAARLACPDGRDEQWLRASVVERMVDFPWPGNVRQLRNAVRHLAVSSRGRSHAQCDITLERMLSQASSDEPLTPAEVTEPSRDIDDERLVSTLRANGWRVGKTANALGIARSTLYRLIDKTNRIRKAKDVSEDELTSVRAECAGNLTAMAERLEVSPRGLRLRMRDLGLEG